MESFTKSKLSLLISAALLSTSSALIAQESNSDTDKQAEEQDVEVINVVGIRNSLRENLNNKRFSNNAVDSINTEDIAKNADKNMAEALQRISGVQITREFGEGSRISIRGTDPALTNTLVNGQTARSAEYLPGRGESNAFNFSNIPAESVSKIEVHKSARADIDAGGIGGTVILHTKKPLDQKDGYGYLNIEGEYNDSSEKSSPQISTAYNFVNDDETFGASIAVSVQERNSFRTGFESDGLSGSSTAVSTGIPQTDAINCPTEACNPEDIKLKHMANHNYIITRHMALNGYTYGDLYDVADHGLSGIWDNYNRSWGDPDTVMDPVYLDGSWALFWGTRRNDALGQTPGRVLGDYVYAPAFEKNEKRVDATVNFQWALTDELSVNLELNRNKTDADNKSDNLYSQPHRLVQYLYSNEVQGVDPRLVQDAERDVVYSATGPLDGVHLVTGMGDLRDGQGYYGGQAIWGEMVRRASNDRTGSGTEQGKIHLTVDYEGDFITAKVQAGRISAESTALDSGTVLATRYGNSTPYAGDVHDDKLPTYEGVNLFYNYNPDTEKVGWGLEADPSLTGEELAAAQQRAKTFLLAPTDEFYLLQGGLTNTARYRENVEDFAQGDVTFELDNDFFIDSVKVGAKFRDVNRDQSYFSENARFHGYANEASPFPLITADALVGGLVSGLDPAGHNIPTEYFDIDEAKRAALLQDNFLVYHSEGTPNEGFCEAAILESGRDDLVGCRSGMTESAGTFYDVNEQIFSYYAMANFSGDFFRGNFGVRVVDTERSSISNEVAKDENGALMSYPTDETDPNYVAEKAGFNMYTPLEQKSSTKDVLPSFNLSVDLAEDLLLRAAWSKNISHPSLYQMRSTFSVVTERFRKYTDGRPQDLTPEGNAERIDMDSQRRASVGNADLGSFESINSELGLEWYFDESSLFAVTAFQKDITNKVRSASNVQDLSYLGEQGQTDNNGYLINGDYIVSSYFNIGEQMVTGLEFQLQHDFDNGFGALVNYTYTDVPDEEYTEASFQTITDESNPETHVSDPEQREYYEVTGFVTESKAQTSPMYGQSEDTLNASVYYESDDVSVRLSYNYRSEYADGGSLKGTRFTDARQQLDLKATYAIMDNLVATFAVTNLTNENVIKYIESSEIVGDPVINKMKWIDDADGNRVVATDDDNLPIVESTITGEEAFEVLSQASGIPVADLKPYYENHLNKMVVSEHTNGRRFYAGINWKF
ncbi:MAG: TonB-dependent receptor [Gammaproteobacteria bacterium]|nr:TonB-dependent receptor [Gammaproteobacteria bacterium]